MAKTENPRRFAAPSADLTPPSVPADLPAPEPPESLDKVRDILFGGQMRAVDGRLQALEERLLSEQAQMLASHRSQIGALEADVRRELQSLAEQAAADRAKRGEELKALGTELRDAIRSLERRHVRLEELGGAADAELRDSILEQSRAVNAQIERLSQRVSADLGREIAGLRHDKVDVAALVGVFSDMAGRLGSALDGGGGGDGARS